MSVQENKGQEIRLERVWIIEDLNKITVQLQR